MFLLVLLACVWLPLSASWPYCSSGQLRLIRDNADIPYVGRVEKCVSSSYRKICSRGWGFDEAKVACRELGFTNHVATAQSPQRYYSYNSVDRNVHNCHGTESRLKNCITTYSSSYCYYAAKVSCEPVSKPCEHDESLQLVPEDSKIPYRGHLEVCRSGGWKQICDRSWDSRDASVACKQLFNTTDSVVRLNKPPTGARDDQTYSCTGNENSLLNCSTATTSLSNCKTAGAECILPKNKCTGQELRLVPANESVPYKGRLEACQDGRFLPVCGYYYWDCNDAIVACKHLGFENSWAQPTVTLTSISNQYFSRTRFHCTGTEKNLAQCSKTTSSCHGSRGADLLCKPTLCSHGDVRLVGAGNSLKNRGRLEVCYKGVWSPAGQFDERAASLVCKQLGFLNYPVRVIRCNSGSVSIESTNTVINNINCDRSSGNITECSFSTSTRCNGYTSFYNSVELECFEKAPCTYGEIRLIGSEQEGKIELCYEGAWTPVSRLDKTAASMACKQLGFLDYPVKVISRRYSRRASHDTMNVWIKSISCSSANEKMDECSASIMRSTSCSVSTVHLENELRCFKDESCKEGALRLVDGGTEQDGRVEVCINRKWGTLCSNNNSIIGHVVCSRLGYRGNDNHWSDGAALEPYFHGFTCDGWEQNIRHCFTFDQYIKSSVNSCAGSIISCSDFCNEGDVRLTGGSLNSGIVEICHNNRWGLIAEPGWTDANAAVVCRQLRLSTGISVKAKHYFYQPRKAIHKSDVYCTGNEEKILDCASFTHTTSASVKLMKKLEVAAVACEGATLKSIDNTPHEESGSGSGSG